MAGFGSANPYNLARDRASQQAQVDTQQGNDAITRRFAAQGALNSGAAIKQQQLAQDSAMQRRDQAIAGIDASEAQDVSDKSFQTQQAKDARDFQSTEAQKGRDFQGQQSGIDRAFQDKVFSFDSASKLRQMDLADKQFALSKDESEFNKRMARHQAGQSGGLFGGGGFLGTGIGAKDADI